jgi:DNA (cytosine-5)-methyltransferase 1
MSAGVATSRIDHSVSYEAPPTTLTSLELFAGAGGLAIGTHRAGFEIVDLIEWSEACCETLRTNTDHLGWKDSRDIEPRDVRKVDFSEFEGGISLLTAGAPCQPFSRGGRRLGRQDERDMLPQVVRAVAEVRPRAFLIENVRGLLFDACADYFAWVLQSLRNPADEVDSSEIGLANPISRLPSENDAYRVEYKVLNAADFGLAQARERLIIVGIAQDEEEFSWPVGSHSRASLIEDLRGDAYWEDHPTVSYAAQKRARRYLPRKEQRREGDRWRTLRDLLAELNPPAEVGRRSDDPSHVHVPGARLYGRHTGSRIDWVGKTVKAGVHGSPGGEHIVVSTPGRFRYLTVRECAELQGFPQHFVLPEKRTPAMRQLGNAVPVPVAEAVAGRIRKCLSEKRLTELD